MDFRIAVMADLPQLKAMYKELIKQMERRNLHIWDEIYPCEFLEEDIKNNQLYVLTDNTEIVSAFALCPSNTGADSINWKDNHAAALYLDRLGVNINYSRKGIGGLSLKKAMELSQKEGAEYLRLFVLAENYPAINLYHKTGFKQADGIYDEAIDDDLVLHEFGFEIKLCY